ncbi:MAG: hypothetical protein JWQ04_2843 [Pedosphaera sp.]|nr:hypothetical protein [Pedosphaera sp.]
MVQGQAGDMQCVLNGNVQQGKTIDGQLRRHEFFQWLAENQFSEAGFDCNLPYAGNAQKAFCFLGLKQGLCLCAQLGSVRDKPEKRMCVGEEFHSL